MHMRMYEREPRPRVVIIKNENEICVLGDVLRSGLFGFTGSVRSFVSLDRCVAIHAYDQEIAMLARFREEEPMTGVGEIERAVRGDDDFSLQGGTLCMEHSFAAGHDG